MNQDTCSAGDCKNEPRARGLCLSCYGKFWRRGEIDETLPKRATHSLTEVDVESKTAVCVICGPVAIRYRQDRDRAECMTVRRKHDKSGVKKSNPAHFRAWHLKSKYGLTVPEYEQMCAEQEGACLLCQESGKQLVVDHCHSTGRVRGLLCNSCNVALGHFRDDPERMRRAVKYVESS